MGGRRGWIVVGMLAGLSAACGVIAYVLDRHVGLVRVAGIEYGGAISGSAWLRDAFAGAALTLLVLGFVTAVAAASGRHPGRIVLRRAAIALVLLGLGAVALSWLRAQQTGISGATWSTSMQDLSNLDLVGDQGPWILLPAVILGAAGALLASAAGAALLARRA